MSMGWSKVLPAPKHDYSYKLAYMNTSDSYRGRGIRTSVKITSVLVSQYPYKGFYQDNYLCIQKNLHS